MLHVGQTKSLPVSLKDNFLQLSSLGWLRWLADTVYYALGHIHVEYVYQVIVDINVLKGCTVANMYARMK